MKVDSMKLLPIDFKDITKTLKYSNSKKNNILLQKGCNVLEFDLITNEENDGDTLGICKDKEIISLIKLPIQSHSKINIKLTLNVDSEKSLLSFVNVSDDFLTIEYFSGGLIMNEQIQIFSFEHFNPFSFDLQLSVPFDEDIQIKVRETVDPLIEIPVKIVDKLNLRNPDDSTEKNPNLKTIIAADTNILFRKDVSYTVEVYRDSILEATDKYSFDFTTFTMMNENNCTVKAFGTRLVVLEFDYPVKNLGEIIHHPAHNNQYELNNLYFSYYGKDLSFGDTKNVWTGDIVTQMDYTVGGVTSTIYPFSIKLSPDNRRLVIQSNLQDLNTGEASTITVNFTRDAERDYSKTITDFSNREIASFEESFLCVREVIAADVNSVIALSNHELEVVFNNPVCCKADGINPSYYMINKLVDPVTLVPLNIDTISRVGNGFNTLLYKLKTDTVNDLLPIPEVELRIGTVLDASGLETEEEDFLVKVPLTEPKFINAYQVIPSTKQVDTQIILEFNEKMTIGAAVANSAENPANYTLVGPEGINILLPLNSITVVALSNDMKFLLTLPYVLPTGEYTITAYDTIKDFTGVNIETTPRVILIMDYVSPLIEKIIVTKPEPLDGNMTEEDNVMIIMFDKQMNISTSDQASTLNDQNYVLEYGQEGDLDYNLYYLGDDTKIENVYDQRWIRFTLPENQMKDFDITKYHIHVGHVKGQNIYYVRSKSGNIYPLCEIEAIDELVNPLSIATGNAEVTNTNEIVYNLESGTNDVDPADGEYENNLFGTVVASDFEVSKDGGITFNVKPISAVFTGYPFNQVKFVFAADTFASSDNIVIRVKASEVKSKDIFGKTIVALGQCPVTNNIPTSLKGIGLLSVNHATRKSIIELVFEKSIATYSVTDFNVVYKDAVNSYALEEADSNLGVPVNSIKPGVRPNTIQLEVTLPTINDAILNNLYVSLSTSTVIPVVIVDENGKAIVPFVDEHVKIMKVDKFNWKYIAPTVADPVQKYEFVLQYNNNVSIDYITTPGTITPAYTYSAGSAVQNVSLDLVAQGVGRINMKYVTASDLGTMVNWNYSVTLDPAVPNTVKIQVSPTAGNDLYADPTTASGIRSGEYVLYPTDTKTGSNVVDKADTVKCFGIAPNAIIS